MGCLSTTMQIAATPITRQQAQHNALTFMQDRGKSISLSSLRHAPMRATQPDELQPYYVFNIGDNQGYVIASGDDCAYAVLGYSDKGHIDLNNLPCNLQAWLDGYAQDIQYLQEHGATVPRAPRKTDNRPAIAPMLTCQWDQNSPYNMYCPIDPVTGRQCLTGCVATAMAQVMYYHRARSVSYTTSEIPGYTTSTRGINVDAIPASSFIDWDNMIDRYAKQDNPTEVQKQAVANLMKFCGTAVKMDYSSDGSGGLSPIRAMQRYFNYSSKARSIRRSYISATEEAPYYSDEEWDEIIYNELANSRPVLYGGHDQASHSGHAFVCDGYDGNGYYHMNWGWGGSSDGYFYLAASDAEEGLNGYRSQQDAVINAEPRAFLPDPEAGIHFADPETKFLCLIQWDEDDDGALSLEEASAVSVIGGFGSSGITSFDELKYFSGLTAIALQAFRDCSLLSNITIPNTVTTIEDGAFLIAGITSVTIPSSVTAIGDDVFYGCNNLKDLTWNAKNCTSFRCPTSIERLTFSDEIELVPDYFAYYCGGLTSVTIPNSVTAIGDYAFGCCYTLTSITIPNTVTTLGERAFIYSGITSVTIPSSVTAIGDDVFYGCNNLKDLTWNAKNCTSFRCPTSIERLTFGDEIEVIPENFAYFCSNLTNVTIPKSVITIGFRAFSRTGLTNVTIPSSVTTIGGEAFRQCNGLKSVTIPSTVTSLGEAAFFNCNGLTNVIIYADNVASRAFHYCNNLKSVTLGKSVKSIEQFAFYDCENVNTVTCLALNPPELSVSFAFDYDLQQFKVPTLRVPIDAVDTYKADSWWRMFPNIVGIDPSLGDVNLDGEVNIADVNAIVDNILANSDDYMSDVNRDGEVNIADINTLIDKILNHQ